MDRLRTVSSVLGYTKELLSRVPVEQLPKLKNIICVARVGGLGLFIDYYAHIDQMSSEFEQKDG
jgi:hypothetical protein